MKIKRIELWHVAIPLAATFHPSWIPGFRQNENRFDLVRFTTESGLEGYSAATAMGNERQGLGALLGPYFLGERADDIVGVRQRLREMSYLGWRVGWLEAACWDIIGKAAGKPVYELLGGSPGRVKLYASTGEIISREGQIEEVQKRLAEGFDSVKLRVHADTLEEDIEGIRRAREAVGDKPILGVDANQGWRVAVVSDAPKWDFERALAFCKEAEKLGFEWVEEPLAMDGYDELVRLRKEMKTLNISGCELNSQGLPEFKVMLEKGCFDKYQPDAVFTGGIAETLEIIHLVKAAGVKYSPHTWTNGIGFAINLQLLGASPFKDTARLEYPFDPPGWVPETRDGLLTRPWLAEKGSLQLPTLPGLGFEIDASALRRHGKRFFKATPLRVAISAVMQRGISEAKKLGAMRDERLSARSAALDRAFAAGEDAVTLALGKSGEGNGQPSA